LNVEFVLFDGSDPAWCESEGSGNGRLLGDDLVGRHQREQARRLVPARLGDVFLEFGHDFGELGSGYLRAHVVTLS
jgi:hypothetical protein